MEDNNTFFSEIESSILFQVNPVSIIMLSRDRRPRDAYTIQH
jgi:hypothetical protein